jgi:GH43 family beta-xylosidase
MFFSKIVGSIALFYLVEFSYSAQFHNPIADFSWPDPYCYLHRDGFYYMPKTTHTGIALYKSSSLTNWRNAEMSQIYLAPQGLMNLWAPEIHFVNGNWYLYFALDNGDNANHRMYVIRALDSNNPMGAYTAEKRSVVPRILFDIYVAFFKLITECVQIIMC